MEAKLLTKGKVSAAVVLYNSDDQVINNIDSYVTQVDKVYVIDNSEVINDDLVASLKAKSAVEYCWMQGNKGIAAALNKAAQLALETGCEYLLMMDDDSYMKPEAVAGMIQFINESSHIRVGVVTAQSDPNVSVSEGKVAESVWYTITSGTLLNLNAYSECGPFMEKLFIDGVDHEYCYRLKKFNYEVLLLYAVFMPHRMGEAQEVKIFNQVVYRWSSHNPVRSYYLVRNFFFILHMYRNVLPLNVKASVYYGVIKACLLDLLLGSDKYLRMKLLLKAISDYRNNNLGKISYPTK
jgi:rhamnosyltransferase